MEGNGGDLVHGTPNESRSHVFRIPDSYSEGPGFEIRSDRWLSRGCYPKPVQTNSELL